MFEQLINQCVENGSNNALMHLVFRNWNKEEIEYAQNYLDNKNCKENNSTTQTLYGFMYFKGYVVKQNYNEALQLFDKAIKQNNIVAMKLRALAFANGHGCPIDSDQAIALLKKAFDFSEEQDTEGKTQIAILIGKLYFKQRDYMNSITWYQNAINLNSVRAKLELARCYMKGLGGNRLNEFKQALTLLDEAISDNFSLAMLDRAKCYLEGIGGLKDIKKAIELLNQACALGDAEAMTFTADLYLKGQYTMKNDDLAAELYFKSYRKKKNPAVLDKLYILAGIGQNLLAQSYLIRIYLAYEPTAALNVFKNNIHGLTPLLYQQLSFLTDNLPQSQAEITQLQQFIEENNPHHESVEKEYYNFKSCLPINKFEAFCIYADHLEHTSMLNSHELYEMGNMTEYYNVEHLSPNQLTYRRERACELYYQAFEKSNEQQYLTKLLHTLKLMQTGISIGITIDINGPEEKALLNQFIEALNRRNQQSAIQALNAYIVTARSYLPQNLTPICRQLSTESLNTATMILEKLNGNLKLINILDNPELLNKISKPSPLYTILDAQFDGKVNPLHRIMSVDECKAILTQYNSGELIYKALVDNKVISAEGLKILARHKEKTIDYMKKLTDDDVKKNIKSVLTFADDDRNPASTLKQYFAVQRGLFKPRSGRGSYKELQLMQEQMSEPTL
ncbi:MAG: tetratricopeptide repeat protein [Legionella sp.]|nr:tetratricopeptide repeat protein [Legionella sp.]